MRSLLLILSLLAFGLTSCVNPEEQKLDRDMHGFTVLHRAAREGDVKLVTELLQQGISPNAKDYDGVTPLHRAARDGDIEVAETFLRYHANPNVRTPSGWTPLHLAVRKERPEMVELLLTWGADLNRATEDGRAALHIAMEKGNRAIIDLLLKDWSLREGGHDVAQLYSRPDISGKADLDLPDAKGNTPLHEAIALGDQELISLLIVKGANVNAANENGQTPLHLAVSRNNEFLVLFLLTNGADVFAENKKGASPLELAKTTAPASIQAHLWEYATKYRNSFVQSPARPEDAP